MKRINVIWLFVLLAVFAAEAQEEPVCMKRSYADEDIQLSENYFRFIKSLDTLSFGELIIETAKYFINTPYVASTLEKQDEHLVINLRELDCTTFVENVMALAFTVKQGVPTFDLFCHNLEKLRYRSGAVSDYTDRLHYFTDWIFENERKGYVRDMTGQIGGEPYTLKLSFMSTHPDSYPQMQAHPEFIEVIQAKEQEISARDVYAMIPEAKINSCAKGMKNGDIICFVTKIAGLDVTHVGFVYWKEKTVGFIHASSSAKKVIIDPKLLQTYAESVQSTIGVMIVRPKSDL